MDVAAPLKNISISIHQYDLTVSFHKNPFEFLKIQSLFSPYLFIFAVSSHTKMCNL